MRVKIPFQNPKRVWCPQMSYITRAVEGDKKVVEIPEIHLIGVASEPKHDLIVGNEAKDPMIVERPLRGKAFIGHQMINQYIKWYMGQVM